ncbi:MAG: YvcK family protein [Acidobacteria bacterium]|nr:MAG: YvcK family protein [Acidobacteriota bacterium]
MLSPPAEAYTRAAGAGAEGTPRPQPRLVALGGGTGLPVLLAGLKAARGGAAEGETDRERLTAIVTVADDGGSSGRLRRAYGMLPPGDIRNCLLALSERGGTLAALFGYRFNGHGEISGHSLGNLILAALSHLESGFERAVERAGDILGATGRVLPATSRPVGLEAEFDDGSRVEGESRIAAHRRRIRRMRLTPGRSHALPQALRAVAEADCILIGPGSLYTSLIPVLLTRGLPRAIARSGARVVLVMNLMTEPGETDGYDARDHLLALRGHAPRLPVHDVIVNSTPLGEPVRQAYAAEGSHPLPVEADALSALGCQVWTADLLAAGPRVRHDPHKLARVILELAGSPMSGAGAA